MDVFASQLRDFDSKIADFRRFFFALEADEKEAFRELLDRVDALHRQFRGLAELSVRTQHDVCNKAGKTIRWADVEFDASTMLAAIRAWDAGEHFAPPD